MQTTSKSPKHRELIDRVGRAIDRVNVATSAVDDWESDPYALMAIERKEDAQRDLRAYEATQ
jgi:hypothetical protein